jgi:hypothetical protein
MNKTAAVAILLSTLLVLSLAGTFFVKYANANPYFPGEVTAPPEGTKPLTITVQSPENNTYYNVTSILLSFNITVGETQPIPNAAYSSAVDVIISEVYYDADWLDGNITVYLPATNTYGSYLDNGVYTRASVEFSGVLSNIPQGEHVITVYATESGWYEGDRVFPEGCYVYQNRFNIRESWVIAFTVDNVAPKISVLLENKPYINPIALDFSLSESVLESTYCLDGQDNVTIAGNSTLPSLSVGLHNVTVYARDAAGNVGASQTVSFTVVAPNSFPVVFVVAVACGVSVAAVVGGLLVYWKKRKR